MKLICGISLIAIAISLQSCGHKETSDIDKSVRVKTICVGQSASSSGATRYPGTIAAGEETPLSFQVAGKVSHINVKVGDRIAKGQTLASLDATSLRNAYDIAAAGEEQANDAYRRMKILHDQKALAEIKWVEVQSAVKQAKSATAIARKALADANLTAPYSGIVASKFIDEGQTVAPFEPVLSVMTATSTKAVISVPENYISSIALGDNGTVNCGDKRYKSIVSEKGVSADPLTRSYIVKLDIKGHIPTDSLLPGMICQVEIYPSQKEATPVFILPADAVLLGDDNRSFVWLNKNGIAVRRFIEIGDMTDDGVVVSKGLNHNDSVIVAGQQKVSEGMKVTSID